MEGGGFLISGQHQNTLNNGMDRGEGLEGWLTLFHFDSRAIPNPSSTSSILNVKKLSKSCQAVDSGNVIGWLRTPRKGYGGLGEFPSAERCGHF